MVFHDYDAGLEHAKIGKVMLDFTGWACKQKSGRASVV